MRALIQRVAQAHVAVEGGVVGRIGRGYVVLLGVGAQDTDADLEKLVKKLVHLRLFPDEQGRLHYSLLEVAGEALVVSQFTLYADVSGGRRPSMTAAAPPELAAPMVDRFVARLQELGVACVGRGQFGAHMQVTLQNDGPVTVWLDSTML